MKNEKKARFWSVVGLALMIAGWAYAVVQLEAAQPRVKVEVVDVQA